MIDLLEKVYTVLTGDSTLMGLIGSGKIGTNLNRKPVYPALTYGLDAGSDAQTDKETALLRVSIYGTNGIYEIGQIAKRVEIILTPKNLENKAVRLHIGKVKKTRYATIDEGDNGVRVEMLFLVYMANVINKK